MDELQLIVLSSCEGVLMAALRKCKDCGNKISKKAASCPQCGAPQKKQSTSLSGCLWIILLSGCVFGGCVIIAGDAIKPLSPQEKMEKALQEKKRAAEQAVAQAEAEKKQREEAAQSAVKTKEDLNAYLDLLNEALEGNELINSASAKGDTVTITVQNLWHVRVKQIRLQDAQNLWKIWAQIHSPKKPDKSRIKIVDLNGNEVGGSGILGGSSVWVNN